MKYSYTKPQKIGITLANGSMIVTDDVKHVVAEDGVLLLSGKQTGAPLTAASLANVAFWGEVSEIEAKPETDGMGAPIT